MSRVIFSSMKLLNWTRKKINEPTNFNNKINLIRRGTGTSNPFVLKTGIKDSVSHDNIKAIHNHNRNKKFHLFTVLY